MAVILQPLVGQADAEGRYFYPTLAGVANSVDFYPKPHTHAQHGCAQLALGLGSSVVDNTPATHFPLSDPRSLTGPDVLPVTALDLHATPGSDELITTLADAAAQALSTVPKPQDVSLAPEYATAVPLTTDVHGEKVVFKGGYGEVVAGAADSGAGVSDGVQSLPLAQILAGEAPIAKALTFLLRLGNAGLGCPVEIEFALKARKVSTAAIHVTTRL